MNRILAITLSLPCLLGTGLAQSTTISPPKPLNCKWYKAPFNRAVGDHLGGTGVINYEGITRGASNHFQVLDGSLKGKGPINSISQVAFHQYGSTCSPCNNGLESYASVTVTMAEFDYDKATNVFAANLVSSQTVVLNNKSVSLPDWTRLPPSLSNSPYNLIFPFSTPYFYSGQNDLCTDILATGGSFGNKTPSTRSAAAAAVLDGQPVYSCSLDLGNPQGMGCRVAGRSKDFNFFAEVAVQNATDASFNLRLADGPPNQPTVMGFSPLAATAAVPGWCQPVLQVPLLFVGGTLNNSGQWNPAFPLVGGYTAALVGTSLYGQAASSEQGVGNFLLTNIAQMVLPRQKTSADKFRFQAVAVADATSATGTMTMRAPVVQYTHQ